MNMVVGGGNQRNTKQIATETRAKYKATLTINLRQVAIENKPVRAAAAFRFGLATTELIVSGRHFVMACCADPARQANLMKILVLR
jgi:hypothetical protein